MSILCSVVVSIREVCLFFQTWFVTYSYCACCLTKLDQLQVSPDTTEVSNCCFISYVAFLHVILVSCGMLHCWPTSVRPRKADVFPACLCTDLMVSFFPFGIQRPLQADCYLSGQN